MVDENLKRRVIEGRKAVERYRNADLPRTKKGHKDHSQVRRRLDKALERLGFDSIKAFFDANERLNRQVINECFKIEGTCDGCPNRSRGCIDACFAKKSIDGKLPDSVTHNLEVWLKIYVRKYGEPDAEGHVIPNCRLRFRKVKEPPIDWWWE